MIERQLYFAIVPFFAFGVCDRLVAFFSEPTITNEWTALISAGFFVLFLIQRR